MEKIEHVMTLRTTPEKLFAAVTTAEGLRGWWSTRCEIDGAVGGTNVMHFEKDGRGVDMEFRIDAMEPAKVQWHCTNNGNPVWIGTTLRWEITASDDGTRMRFVHEGFTRGGPPYEMTVGGWKHFINSLKQYLEEGNGQPWA